MSRKGAGLKQIIIQPCGVPGSSDCPFSELETVVVPVGATRSIITDIGELLFLSAGSINPNNVALQFQTALNTWVDLMPTGDTQPQQFFSDGSNLSFQSQDTSTTQSGSYYIIQ
jgi:hypothetical protein